MPGLEKGENIASYLPSVQVADAINIIFGIYDLELLRSFERPTPLAVKVAEGIVDIAYVPGSAVRLEFVAFPKGIVSKQNRMRYCSVEVITGPDNLQELVGDPDRHLFNRALNKNLG